MAKGWRCKSLQQSSTCFIMYEELNDPALALIWGSIIGGPGLPKLLALFKARQLDQVLKCRIEAISRYLMYSLTQR